MAASTGAIFLKGKSGRSYIIDTLAVDAANSLDNLSPEAASSASPTAWKVPEDCMITNYIQTGATTAVRRQFRQNGSTIPGGTLRCAMFTPSATVIALPPLGIPIRGGTELSIGTLA